MLRILFAPFKPGTVKIKFYCRQLPDQIWVQCDHPECLKWRKLPEGTDPDKLPDKWYCKDNPNPRMRSCSIPEEKEEEVEQPYVKTQKKRLWVHCELSLSCFLSVPLWNTWCGVNFTFFPHSILYPFNRRENYFISGSNSCLRGLAVTPLCLKPEKTDVLPLLNSLPIQPTWEFYTVGVTQSRCFVVSVEDTLFQSEKFSRVLHDQWMEFFGHQIPVIILLYRHSGKS